MPGKQGTVLSVCSCATSGAGKQVVARIAAPLIPPLGATSLLQHQVATFFHELNLIQGQEQMVYLPVPLLEWACPKSASNAVLKDW